MPNNEWATWLYQIVDYNDEDLDNIMAIDPCNIKYMSVYSLENNLSGAVVFPTKVNVTTARKWFHDNLSTSDIKQMAKNILETKLDEEGWVPDKHYIANYKRPKAHAPIGSNERTTDLFNDWEPSEPEPSTSEVKPKPRPKPKRSKSPKPEKEITPLAKSGPSGPVKKPVSEQLTRDVMASDKKISLPLVSDNEFDIKIRMGTDCYTAAGYGKPKACGFLQWIIETYKNHY